MKKYISIIVCLIFAINLSVCVAAEDETVLDASTTVAAELMTFGKSAVLMEKSTGKVLYAVNENEKVYPASVTKIMAILLICEAIENGKISLNDVVTCSENASSKGGSQIWLKVGEKMSVDDLLKATCVYSANDACTLLGEYISGSEQAFISLMNKRKDELGMKNTHFDNCTGLDDTTDAHLTTAYDVALMSRALLRFDFIKKYTTIWMDSLRGGETELVNTNKLVRYYDGITGLKTGTTAKAGCCVSATAERDGMELIAVVMGSQNSKDRFTSAENMLDWGFANYEIYEPIIELSKNASIKVTRGMESDVCLKMPTLQPILINKGQRDNIQVNLNLPQSVEAPVTDKTELGNITVTLDKKILAEYKIFPSENVEKINFIGAVLKLLRSFGK